MIHSPFLRRILAYARPVRGWFALSLGLLLVMSSLTAAKAAVIKPAVDRFVQQRADLGGLLLLCGAVLAIFAVQAAAHFGYVISARRTSCALAREIRRDLFRHLLAHGLAYFSARPSAAVSSRVVNDVSAYQNNGIHAFQAIVRDLTTIALLLGLTVRIHWRLALLCLLVIGAAGLAVRISSRRIRRRARNVQETLGRVVHELTELVGGIEVVLSFGLLENWRKRLDVVLDRQYQSQIRLVRSEAAGLASVQVIAGIGFSTVLFILGRATIHGEITPGSFAMFLSVIYLLQRPAENLPKAAARLSQGLAAGGRALEILDEAPTLSYPDRSEPFPSSLGRIELAGVSFSYPRGEGIENLDLSLEPRRVTAMLGASGAGKSTVARLMLRFYDPDQGVVRLDGVDLRRLSRTDLHGAIAYVGQEVFLFDEDIEFNLRLGDASLSRESLWKALRQAELADFVQGLPEGLATPVGERGVQLSGGQRQRLSIARALLRNPRVLILDEATSALDEAAERRLLANLRSIEGRPTLFAISHRSSVAEIADRVVVLDQGRLVPSSPRRDTATASPSTTKA
jgi:subfamily B ATP-binding cassette protein MsbA